MKKRNDRLYFICMIMLFDSDILNKRFKNRKIEVEEAALMRVIKKLGFIFRAFFMIIMYGCYFI